MDAAKSLLAGFLLITACGCPLRTPPTDNASSRSAPQTQPQISEAAWQARVAAAQLAPEKQNAIWDAEHATFEIETRFGREFLTALKNQDAQALSGFFREPCQIAMLAQHPELRVNKLGIREHRSPAADQRQAEPAELVDHWLQQVSDWDSMERMRLRVLHIERLAPDAQRWKTKLLLTVTGRRGDALVMSESKHDMHCTLSEEEQQIGQEPLIDAWHVRSEITRQGPSEMFREVTTEAGLDKLPIPDNWQVPLKDVQQYQFQVAVDDFNLDGYLDIAVATLGERPLLLQSVEGRRFVEVSQRVGLTVRGPLQNFLAAWIDFDNDGYPDLLMGDRLYRNHDGRRFEDVTDSAGLRFDPECLGAVIADYDADGRLDIYALYQREFTAATTAVRQQWVEEDETGKSNILWRNAGQGIFLDATRAAAAGGGKRHTHAAAWFHFDGDAWPDLYVANDFGRNVILRNRGNGTFTDVSATTVASDFATSMGVATGDLNNDGCDEIYVANMFSKMGRRIIAQVSHADYPDNIFAQIQGSCAGNRLYRRPVADQEYEELATEWGVNEVGWAFAPAMFDVDNDGWLDLYATTGFISFHRDKPDG